ncbi:MAG: class I adenylate-forming enzyme family protein [Terricaulis sp.]
MSPNNALLIQDVTDWRRSSAPDAEAIVQGELRMSNRDLAVRVDAISKGLLAHGIARGDFVATLAPPSADFWLLLLATSSIGAIWQGLNPRYQRNEYAYLLEDAAPKLVFAREEFDGRAYRQELQDLAGTETRFIALAEAPIGVNSEFCRAGADISDAALKSARALVQTEDPAVIVYTSGTTGKPKGALISQRAIVQTALANIAWMDPALLTRTACPAPINHVGAINNVCMNTYAAGGGIIFYPRVDLAALGQINRTERPTFLVASPTAFAMMLAQPNADFASIDYYKVIIFGGAATPIAYLEEVVKTGAKLSSVYGQTETTGIVTYTPFGASLEAMSETIGQALAGNEVRIANDQGVVAKRGETGEIQVKGVSVMSGYHNRPEATKEAFTPDGWLRTGDLGLVREDGNIVFAGRLKEMFKSGGYNVYPVEVELAICEHDDVAQAVVVAVEHPTFQEVGHGFLLAKPGHTIDPSHVKAFLRERIADYKIPKTWEVLPAFPFLPNGKIDKRALAALLAERRT